MKLYNLFVMSRNNVLSDGIEKERQKILRIIATLETLLEDTALFEDDIDMSIEDEQPE